MDAAIDTVKEKAKKKTEFGCLLLGRFNQQLLKFSRERHWLRWSGLGLDRIRSTC